MFDNEIWLLLLTITPILVAGLIGFAMLRRRRQGPAQRREHDAALKRLL